MIRMTAKVFCNSHYVKTLFLHRRSPITGLPNYIYFNFKRQAHSTIDEKDLFQANKELLRTFWDAEGPFSVLHRLNYIRLPYIRDGLVDVAPGEKLSTCLKGKKILDVGCGAGVLSEGLAKFGAEVTGIDTSKQLVELAKEHSSKNKRLENNLPSYILTTIEEHCIKYSEIYDAVVVSEVIEHVAEKELFLESCVRAAKPGGKLFFTTPSRTRVGQFFVIFVCESVLNIIPKGTHEYNKFMRPSELKHMLEMNDCFVESTKGFVLYPLANYWEWTKHTMCFFAMEARLEMINMTAKLLCDLQTRSVKTLLFRRWNPNTVFTNNIYQNCRRNAHSTIDGKDFFQVNKAVSWDPEGPLKPLYVLNHIRVPYIRDSLINVAPGQKFSTCLEGKKILDVGCGGGYLAEALAKLGAEVTGIDTNKEAIQYAKRHSSNNTRLANNMPAYILSTIEEYCEKCAESYDVVIASEVIDHVAEKELFVESCVRAAKPGAKIFFTTINRTRLAQFVLIFVYENIFKVIPKGAHDYNMFIKPSELKYMLEMNDCFVESTKGYFYYPFAQYWEWMNNYQFFFAIEAVKSK